MINLWLILRFVLYLILILLVLFLAVLVIRAVSFKPKEEPEASGEPLTLDSEKIVRDMVEMIRCKTISYNDASLIDQEEFARFQNLLPELYPQLHKACTREFVGENGMLYC